MIRTCYFVVDLKDTTELTQIYDSVKKQNEEILPRLYEREYYIDFEKAQNEPALSITYLEDWFSEETMPHAIVKTVELKNSTECSAKSEKVFCLVCTHQDDNLLMTFNYGLSYLKPQNAERFISILENTAKEMLKK